MTAFGDGPRSFEPWPSAWTTPELAPPLTTTLHQWENVSALDRFNVHRCPTLRIFSGTGRWFNPRIQSPISSVDRERGSFFQDVQVTMATSKLVAERLNINVVLLNYMRAFDDRPPDFEPWSSDVDDN
ncbi:hypothetical protein TNCV_3902151 [Trichonephila clavipes]|nr:hypothetical protein TNCV_3902151 [Trichonephila clavipes]